MIERRYYLFFAMFDKVYLGLQMSKMVGRIVIQKHLDELTLVEVNSAKELIDIDTLSILNELQD